MQKKLIFFIYDQRGMRCSRSSLHRCLHGRREIRITVNDLGEVIHKPFEYPGVPHADVVPRVIAVESTEAQKIRELFQCFNVSYSEIVPKKIVYVDGGIKSAEKGQQIPAPL